MLNDNRKMTERLTSVLSDPPSLKNRPYSYQNLGTLSSLGSVKPQPEPNPYAGKDWIPQNNPFKTVDNYKERLDYAGIEIPAPKKPGLANALMTALDVLQRPQYMVTNAMQDLTDDKRDSFGDILKGAFQGLTGKRKSSVTDTFDNLGWHNDPSKKWYQGGNLVRNIAGFIGDVAVDPTTYLTAGTLGLSKGVTKEGAERLGLRSMDELAQGIAQKFSRLGASSDDILKLASKHGDQANLVLEMAERLGTEDEILRVLDRGVKAINTDMIQRHGDDLQGRLADLLGQEKKLNKRQSLSMSGNFKDTFKGNLDLQKTLSNDPEQMKTFINRLQDAFGNMPTMSDAQQREILQRVYGGRVIDKSVMNAHSTMEVRVLDILSDTFEGAKFQDLMDTTGKLIDNMITPKGNTKTLKNLEGILDSKIKLITDKATASKGVEFANGLQRLYNDATKKFYYRFMGKPFLNITDSLGSVGQKATDSILTAQNKIGEGARRVTNILGGIFQPEHMDVNLKAGEIVNRAGDVIGTKYEAGKQAAKMITEYIQRETGLPKHALDATVSIFVDHPEFLADKKLRELAVWYLEAFGQECPYALTLWNEKALAEGIINTSGEFIDQNVKSMFHDIFSKNEMANQAFLDFDMGKGQDLGKILDYDPTSTSGYVKRLYKVSRTRWSDEVSVALGRTTEGARSGAFKKTAAHAEQRKFKTIGEAIVRGNIDESAFTVDLLASMSARHLDSLRVALNNEMEGALRNMAEEFPAMFEGLMETSGKGGLQKVKNLNLYVSDEIMETVKRVVDFPEYSAGWEDLMESVDQFTNFVKTMQTSANPSFVVRNLIGEPMMNWFAGVKVKYHTLAQEIIKDTTSNKVARIGDTLFLDGNPLMRITKNDAGEYITQVMGGLEKEVWNKQGHKAWDAIPAGQRFATRDQVESFITQTMKAHGVATYMINGKELTASQVMDVFFDNGLGWSGITRGNLVENIQQTLRKEVRRQGQSFLNVGERIGDWTETWSRLAHMLDRLDDRGLAIRDAAMDVRKYHVDYRDLTTVERRVFRRVAPYYTYMRKNVPMQFRILATDPGKLSAIFKLVRHSHEAMKRQNGGKDIETPDYLKEGLALPIDTDEKGNVRYLNWNLPLTDLARLKYDLGELFQTNITDMLHPGIKAIFEIPTNRSVTFDTPIEKYDGERAPLFTGHENGKKILPKTVDYGIRQLGFVETLRKEIGRVLNEQQGVPEDPMRPRRRPMLPMPGTGASVPLPLMDSLLPLKNQNYTALSNAYDYRDQLQGYVKRLQEEHGISLPRVTKDMRYAPKIYYTPKNTPRRR